MHIMMRILGVGASKALYSSEIMSKEMKESTEKKGAGYLKALLKRVAEGWGSLNEEQKSGYKATAAEDSERHATEFKAFKESEAYQGFVKKAAELYKESKAELFQSEIRLGKQ